MEEIRAIRKVELHQHVDGSIPVPVIWRMLVENGLNPVPTQAQMERLLKIQPEEEGSLLGYLDKFHYPLWITQFYENIQNVTRAIVEEAYECGVRLLELRYSPIIHTHAGLTVRQAIRAVLSEVNAARERHRDLKAGLVVIAMRQHGPHIARMLARQSVAEAQWLHERTGVVGFDIAGAERGAPPRLFRPAYEIARKGGLGLTAHVGEDEGGERVWEAIDDLGVDRVGHACSAVADGPLLARLARDRILVECCLTSNAQTGAVRRGERHPIYAFLEKGIPVAICTDNTTVSGTDQNIESALVARELSVGEVERIHREAEGHSFIARAAAGPPGAAPGP